MRTTATDTLIFSPSDLCVYAKSPFASWMDRWHLVVAERTSAPFVFGEQTFPDFLPDEDEGEGAILAARGMEHERAFLETLRAEGKQVVELGTRDLAATQRALEEGTDVLYQPYLESPDGRFGGYADFLVRGNTGEDGKPRYDVWDTKLARSERPTFILQLCLYAEMLGALQGALPMQIGVVLGTGERRSYPLNRFFHLFRHIKDAFLAFQDAFDPAHPPHPADSREYGRWSGGAERILETLDHLSGVANITRGQIRKLEEAGIGRVAQLAAFDRHPDRIHVPGIAPRVLSRLVRQASLQIASRELERPRYNVVPPDPDDPRRGLALLPPASPRDVYFDIEGYPFAEGGLEYLWGTVAEEAGQPRFRDWWGHDDGEEKAAFEGFIDWVMERFRADPAMHVYHYAPYETTAVRRLSSKYATREEEVDELLRGQVFVDLYPVVRQGFIIGVSSYSLKYVEHLYRGRRAGEVVNAGASVVAYHRWIQSGEPRDWTTSPLLRQIRDYNEEDCVSTWELGRWLRERQAESGVEWISPFEATATEQEEAARKETLETDPRRVRRRELPRRLDASFGFTSRKEEAVLLGGLVGYHWREAKPVFWRKFDRAAKTPEELVDDPDCLGALERCGDPRPDKKSLIYPCCFDPDQETKIQEGGDCFVAENLACRVHVFSLDRQSGQIELRTGKNRDPLPAAFGLIPDEYVKAEVVEDAVHHVAEEWCQGKEPPSSLRDLLAAAPPRLVPEAGIFHHHPERGMAGIVESACALDGSVLALQGPPGAGKTYAASRIIAELAARGRTVGVTALSHKAIMNLLRAVLEALDERGLQVPVVKAGKEQDDPIVLAGRIILAENNELGTLLDKGARILGATAWGFSRPDLRGRIDTLFIDEAGQFSLANAVAVGTSARNVMLLGDQMQLAQPLQGSHPGRSGVSCLEHLLGDHATVPPERGVFLETTRRMHPAICRFISEAFYEGKLHALPGLERQGLTPVRGSVRLPLDVGIHFEPVKHEGNSQASDEEAARILDLTRELLCCDFTDAEGRTRPLALNDILFVAPFNMQVRNLRAKLTKRFGGDPRVGSVDRFQGQEAPVVVLSMCSSTRADSPRGMDFLCDPHRLNVALSRAQALALVVGSPGLLAGDYGSLREMELANLYAWIMAWGRKDA